jgi:class 3 adenylate cyclase/tetratricopeptide (TPR) repeat protein
VLRKTVTVLFADVTGSTALGESLDPEALRRVMSRYFEQARAILERHGGTVEKFIGDAVMAVFGVPVTHEDDALRAARAAVELRDADLGVVLRIGVNTGEVVAAEGETLVTGDAVNVAARLEQAAAPGEVLLGDSTYRLARNAVRVEAHDAIDAKGKSEPVPTWTLVEVLDDVPAFTRQLDAPFVGRGNELSLLTDAFERVVAGQSAQRVTLLGGAGIGKSRLARELVQHVGDRARIVVGRCLAYGEGITYWPLAEIVRTTAGSDRDAIHSVAGDDVVADRIAAVVGFGGEAGTKEETQWAARRYLEALAAEQPLVVVLDDLHWAEPTFLDLVEYVADFAAAPILLLATARPDLLESRPAWTSPRPNASTVVLEPLNAEDAAALLVDVDEETRARILVAAEGNPLFVEQLVAMRAEGDGEFVVPPTIHALLAARIDALDAPERAVVERASVEGRLFHRGSVTELSPDDVRPDVGAHLLALVRKEYVRPDRTQLPGDDGYRFAHILVRDAAYDAMSKELRADLHVRFVDWLERVGAERAGELQEILGFHLEQAALYRRELGLDDGGVAARAAERLGASGTRAHDQGDLPAAKNLLERAVALLPRADPARVRLLPLLGSTLYGLGELEPALTVLGGASEEAEAAGDRASSISAWAWDCVTRMQVRPDTDHEEIERELVTNAAEAEKLADPRAVLAIRRVSLFLALMRANARAMRDEAQALHVAARQAGDRHAAAEAMYFAVAAITVGGFPPEEVEEEVGRLRASAQGPLEKAALLQLDSTRSAQRGDYDAAMVQLAEMHSLFLELAQRMHAEVAWMFSGVLELQRGHAEAAEAVLRRGVDGLRALGETGFQSTQLGLLGEALCQLGRWDEAEEAAQESKELTQAGDIISQAYWRVVRARVCAHRREREEAAILAGAAVELVADAEAPIFNAGVLLSAARVFTAIGDENAAAAAVARAIELYDNSGFALVADRLREEWPSTTSFA